MCLLLELTYLSLPYVKLAAVRSSPKLEPHVFQTLQGSPIRGSSRRACFRNVLTSQAAKHSRHSSNGFSDTCTGVPGDGLNDLQQGCLEYCRPVMKSGLGSGKCFVLL